MSLLNRFAKVFRQMRLEKLRQGGAKEEMYDARLVRWLASSLQDVRHGAWLLHRERGSSALMLLVVALGIGGSTAVFSLLKAAFFDELPYPASERLITINESSGWVPSVAEFAAIRAQARTMEEIGFARHTDMQLAAGGQVERVFAARVSASFLRILGAGVARGRLLVDEDNQPGRAPVVVLTDAFWRGRLGADADVVGRTLRFDAVPATVVGILTPEFHFDYPTLDIAEPVDLYVADPIDTAVPPHPSGDGLGVAARVVARLRRGVTGAQAQAELQAVAQGLIRIDPRAFPAKPIGNWPAFSFTIQPLRQAIIGRQRALLGLLASASAILLLIACANTAEMLLARALRRGKETVTRAALGASRARLARQFLLEGLVVGVCGGALGLLLAGVLASALVAVLPVRSPLLAAAHIDWRVAGFALLVALFCSLLFSTIPAIQGGRTRPGVQAGNRWRHGLLALEAMLSVFLLCGAALVGQNLWALIATPIGIDPHQTLIMRLQLPGEKPDFPSIRAGAIFRNYLDRIEAVPGVEAAATVTGPPLRPVRGGPGRLVGQAQSVLALNHQISPHYFRALRIPLIAGRAFDEHDAGARVRVAIVNEECGRRYGLGSEIVGRQFEDPGGPVTIVGMVANVRVRGLQTAPFPEVYLSSGEFAWPNAHLVVRSKLPPARLLGEIRSAVRTVDPEQAVFGAMTMDEWISASVREPRFQVYLIGAFALLALTLAAAGVYGVVSYLVEQRTAEIALRLALGADGAALARTIVGRSVIWATAGLMAGLSAALRARTTLRALSSSIVTGSAALYVAAAAFFLLVTLAATVVPLRRACRLDPAAALRCE